MIRYKTITSKGATEFLLPRHYSGRKPSISFAYGAYHKDRLIAVCTIGKPASNSLCVGVCGKEYSSYVYELNRLCVDDNIETPFILSKFVSYCLNAVKQYKLIIVSYADTDMNHNGYIPSH